MSCSRDGVCKVWHVGNVSSSDVPCLTEFRPFDGVSVTAVDSISFGSGDHPHFLAIGSEFGEIQLWSLQYEISKGVRCSKLFDFAPSSSHGSSVRRLRWNPHSYSEIPNHHEPGTRYKIELASCGDDHFVRIFQVEIRPSSVEHSS